MKISLLVLIALLLPISASMISGDAITIDKPHPDDLYIAGGTVTINAPIRGDLLVAGGRVTINDSVQHDLMVAGGTVIVNGYVGDDLRCAGGNIQLLQRVEDDALLAGGRFTLSPAAQIGGNLISLSGEGTLHGQVNGNVFSRAEKLNLNSKVGRDLDARAGEIIAGGEIAGRTTLSAQHITVGPTASFAQEVRFWNADGKLDIGARNAGTPLVFDPSLTTDEPKLKLPGFSSAILIIGYLGTALLVIYTLQLSLGATFAKAAESVLTHSLQSLGLGIIGCIGLPVATILALITMIGIPLALMLFVCTLVLVMLATSVTAIITAHWINQVYYQATWTKTKIAFAGFGIFVVFKLITFTPVVGLPIMVMLSCTAFGAILLTITKKAAPASA